MWSLNTFLTQEFAWYRAWSNNPYSSPIHLALFGLFTILAFMVVFERVTEFALLQEQSNVAAATMALSPASKDAPAQSKAGVIEPTEVIVGFKSSVGDIKRNEIAATQKLTKQGELKALQAVVYTTDGEDTPREVADRVRHLYGAEIAYIEPNAWISPEEVPNDPLYDTEWHIPKTGVDVVWNTAHGSGTLVAVLDTGIDCTHPELSDACVAGYNVPSQNTNTSDVYGHGTKVAGVIAAAANNNLGVAGAAYGARIMPVRITNDSQGMASYSDIANGMLYAANQGVKIANVSYAAYESQTVAAAAAYLASKGGIVTMAAGNNGTKSTVKNDPNIIVVSASDSGDRRASWSSYGSPVDIAAPGSAISTTAPGGGFISMSGTSFASPLTAAIAALVWSAAPTLTNTEVQNVVLGTALDLDASGYDEEYGFGRADAAAALAAALSGNIPTVTYSNSGQNEALLITSYAVVSKTKNSGVVSWATNVPASGRVRYGTTPTALSGVVDIATVALSQQATVSGLDPRKKYYYQVEAVDAAGLVVKSPVAEFRTTRK